LVVLEMDDLTMSEQAQFARLGRYYRTAPLDSYEDNPQAIRSLLEKGYLDCLQFGDRPAMYRIRAGKLPDLQSQDASVCQGTQAQMPV